MKDSLNIDSGVCDFGVQVPCYADTASHAFPGFSVLHWLPYLTKQ